MSSLTSTSIYLTYYFIKKIEKTVHKNKKLES